MNRYKIMALVMVVLIALTSAALSLYIDQQYNDSQQAQQNEIQQWEQPPSPPQFQSPDQDEDPLIENEGTNWWGVVFAGVIVLIIVFFASRTSTGEHE